MKKEKKVEMRGTDQSRKSKKGVAGIGVEFLPHTTFPFCSQHPQKTCAYHYFNPKPNIS